MSGLTVQFVFDEMAKGIASDASVVSKVNAVFHFKVSGKSWTVDLKNAPGSVKQAAPAQADCTINIEESDFINMMLGKATGQNLFMQGKLKIQGNMALAMKLEKIPKVSAGDKKPEAATPASAPSSSSSDFRSQAVFDDLTKRIASTPSLVQQVGGVYQFDITSSSGKQQSWNVDLKNGKGSVGSGKNDKADCTLTVNDEDFVGMMTGKLNSQQLFMQGKLKIKGNMGLAMKLNKLQAAKASL